MLVPNSDDDSIMDEDEHNDEDLENELDDPVIFDGDFFGNNYGAEDFPGFPANGMDPMDVDEEDEAGVEEGDEIRGALNNPYAPFTSQLDWELARWAKLRSPGSTAMTELLQIEGLHDALGLSYKTVRELDHIIDHEIPGRRPRFEQAEIEIEGETFDVWHRDVLDCVRALFSDKAFAPFLVFAPERHYSDDTRTSRLYHDIHTGKWWWTTQEKLEEKKPGATIVPIILTSDKTQVTLFRGKTAYPVYLTIGNIPKEIRRKPSRQAHILLAYLPTTRLEHVTNKAARRRMVTNVYHTAMRHILSPLKNAGLAGVPMASGDGVLRRTHPILAAHGGDYLENFLVVGCKMGECPRCTVPTGELGSIHTEYPLRNLGKVLDALRKFDSAPLEFPQACQEAGIKQIPHPYWEELPYCNIFTAIPPDILHQLYQGLVKHLISWIISVFDNNEIDARCRRLPPNHHIQHFPKGITSLSRLTGQEHSNIARILLGLIIDLPLPDGRSPVHLIKASRALLDFLYYAQYPVHSTNTLNLLHEALQQFHEYKHVFVDLGVREDFELPKLHFARHYIALIKAVGTPDNFNTEYTERLHIDYAKAAYAATNHKNEFSQMTIWLERKEKILQHEEYIKWCLAGRSHIIPPQSLYPPPPPRIRMTKHPSQKAVPLTELAEAYQAPFIQDALARYITRYCHPTFTSAQIEDRAADLDLPLRSLPVYHKAHFWLGDINHHRLMSDEDDVLHARPARTDKQGKIIPARFDTALINCGTGEYNGIDGYRIAQVKVIFSIPSRLAGILFPPEKPPPQYLAYVEWFTPFDNNPRPNNLFYRIKRSLQNNKRLASIIPLNNIRRSVHLYPSFGNTVPREWTSSTVLDQCPSFFVNSFSDRHAYHTIM
ncbi:hypothetical protein BDW22DRAFT_1477302 [Trametopsis cervina]|nr:hypothetical protein BDW22DRAFT_1477302 [Trametopsis cervina]